MQCGAETGIFQHTLSWLCTCRADPSQSRPADFRSSDVRQHLARSGKNWKRIESLIFVQYLQPSLNQLTYTGSLFKILIIQFSVKLPQCCIFCKWLVLAPVWQNKKCLCLSCIKTCWCKHLIIWQQIKFCSNQSTWIKWLKSNWNSQDPDFIPQFYYMISTPGNPHKCIPSTLHSLC